MTDLPNCRPCELEEYDAGFLGGDQSSSVGWWHDYIRAELDRAYEYYQDQVNQMQPVPEWRPIEEAPRDGTSIILYYGSPSEGCPFYEVASWPVEVGGFDPWTVDGQRPTHYMPLPTPPMEKKDDAE